MNDSKSVVNDEATNVREFISCTVTLDAGDAKTVGLGRYDNPQAASDFNVEVQPGKNDEFLGSSLEMLPIPGTSRFMGLYHLHNYGDKGLEVAVTRRSAGERA